MKNRQHASSDAPIYDWQFTKDQIKRQDFSHFLSEFGDLSDMRLLRDRQGAIVLSAGGYDDDPRELPEIMEVRAFYRTFYDVFPHWFFFVDPRCLMPMLHCVLNTYTVIRDDKKGKVLQGFEDTEMAAFIEKQKPLFFGLCKRAGMSTAESESLFKNIASKVMQP